MTDTNEKSVMDPTVELIKQLGHDPDVLTSYERGQAIIDKVKEKMIEIGPKEVNAKGYDLDHARFVIEMGMSLLPESRAIEDIIDIESVIKFDNPDDSRHLENSNYTWLNMDGFNGYWAYAKTTPALNKSIQKYMLSNQSMYLDLTSKAIDGDDQRIYMKYNHIIGSRLVSRIDAQAIKDFAKHVDTLPIEGSTRNTLKSGPGRR